MREQTIFRNCDVKIKSVISQLNSIRSNSFVRYNTGAKKMRRIGIFFIVFFQCIGHGKYLHISSVLFSFFFCFSSLFQCAWAINPSIQVLDNHLSSRKTEAFYVHRSKSKITDLEHFSYGEARKNAQPDDDSFENNMFGVLITIIIFNPREKFAVYACILIDVTAAKTHEYIQIETFHHAIM